MTQKNKTFLVTTYRATAKKDDNGVLETYEAWLERQLLSRMKIIEASKSYLSGKMFTMKT